MVMIFALYDVNLSPIFRVSSVTDISVTKINQPYHQQATTIFHWQYDYICQQMIFLRSNRLKKSCEMSIDLNLLPISPRNFATDQ